MIDAKKAIAIVQAKEQAEAEAVKAEAMTFVNTVCNDRITRNAENGLRMVSIELSVSYKARHIVADILKQHGFAVEVTTVSVLVSW